MEPYESLQWMWEDACRKDPSLRENTLGAKHAKMFFAFGAHAFYIQQHQRMLKSSDDNPQEWTDLLMNMRDETIKMLQDAKRDFQNHPTE